MNIQIETREGFVYLTKTKELRDSWCFYSEEDDPLVAVPKSIAPDEKTAESVCRMIAAWGNMSYRAGLEKGRSEAQRFFRLALGVEEPTYREAALWNAPVPLKEVVADG